MRATKQEYILGLQFVLAESTLVLSGQLQSIVSVYVHAGADLGDTGISIAGLDTRAILILLLAGLADGVVLRITPVTSQDTALAGNALAHGLGGRDAAHAGLDFLAVVCFVVTLFVFRFVASIFA